MHGALPAVLHDLPGTDFCVMFGLATVILCKDNVLMHHDDDDVCRQLCLMQATRSVLHATTLPSLSCL